MAHGTEYSRVNRVLPVIGGVVLIAAAFALDLSVDKPGCPPWLNAILVVLGCAVLVTGIAAARHRRLSAALAKLSLAILSAVFAVTAAELGLRAVGFDFGRFKGPAKELPIYYRAPSVHAGEGILRRPGPASWSGKPISAFVKVRWGGGSPYPDEQPIVVEYDALGFRNPAALGDWEVVVTGDSFVEQGCFRYEDMFTSIAGKQLGVRIKNLGVSTTGPLSQIFYVRHYGKAASTKDAVLCFFEGNDLEDLDREIRATELFRRTGEIWRGEKQVSLVNALFSRRTAAASSKGIQPNAVATIGGVDRPMTVGIVPPTWRLLSQKKQLLVAATMTNWARMTRGQGMRPWVMCIPDMHRVFHGHVRFADTNSALAHWVPGDFAPHLAKICAELDVRFIDPFPALRQEVEAGRVPYNLIADNHLSIEGSRVVASVLADALRPETSAAQP